MATFKRLTDIDGDPIYINLDLVHLMYRLNVGERDPMDDADIDIARTRLVFHLDHGGEEDTYEISRDVLETPHSIVG